MAEIRKHDPEAGEGIAKLVREAMGETIRPVEPGPAGGPVPDEGEDIDEADDAPASSLTSIPVWDQTGPTYNF